MPLPPPPFVAATGLSLPLPLKSMSTSELATSKEGGADVTPRDHHLGVTVDSVAAVRGMWPPFFSNSVKQRPPWCQRLHQVDPLRVGGGRSLGGYPGCYLLGGAENWA